MIWLMWMLACGSEPSDQRAAEPAPAAETAPRKANPELMVDLDNPQECATCHAQVVQEWRESMHSRAHHDRDPIYGSMRALRMELQGEEIAGKCAQCHNPRAPTELESPAALQGVSCATCHAASEVVHDPARKGAKGITRSATGVLLGPHDVPTGASAVHGTGDAAPWLADGKTMCLVCHDQTETPGGVDACTTGPEYAESEGGQTCVSCHMPEVDGASGTVSEREMHAHHGFLGPHRAWNQDDAGYLSTAVSLDVRLDGDTVTAQLENLTHHAFPTGFPGRMAVVRAVGKNAAGEVAWVSFADDPGKDPQALLRKVYVDEAGQPTLPPLSSELKVDSRLAPDELRTFTWEVPSAVQQVEVVVSYRLLTPPAAKRLKLEDADEASPQVVARASAERG